MLVILFFIFEVVLFVGMIQDVGMIQEKRPFAKENGGWFVMSEMRVS